MKPRATTRELTIGALARRANVATSMLRFYEREGLLQPARRTPSGYRLYPPDAEKTLLFIHRAQRLGFSLGDIRLFLEGRQKRDIGGQTVVGIAEQRFLEIERRLTELLVLRHELELFLQDLPQHIDPRGGGTANRLYRDLVDHVCGHGGAAPARSSVAKLIRRLGCALQGVERERVFDALRGHHVHIWRDADGYSILVPGREPAVEAALRRLAEAEAGCHAHVEPRVAESQEGWLFTARGPNAFLFAQLFLALEASEA
jgi:DNA-binding transcriptional MerR regulator